MAKQDPSTPEQFDWTLAQQIASILATKAGNASSIVNSTNPSRPALGLFVTFLETWSSKRQLPKLSGLEYESSPDLRRMLHFNARNYLQSVSLTGNAGLWLYPNPHHATLTLTLTHDLAANASEITTSVYGERENWHSSIELNPMVIESIGASDLLIDVADEATEYLAAQYPSFGSKQEIHPEFPDSECPVRLEPITGRAAGELAASRWQRFAQKLKTQRLFEEEPSE